MGSRSSRKDEPRLRKVGHVAAACYLWAKGHQIVKTEWSDSLCKWFFEDTAELKEDIDTFFNDEAKVNPREFFPRVTEFKRHMYEDNPKRREEVNQD
jgi:hypothetical protein